MRFVSLQVGGWDNHTNIFNNLKTKLLPKFDGGVSALLNGLEQKELLSKVRVEIGKLLTPEQLAKLPNYAQNSFKEKTGNRKNNK